MSWLQWTSLIGLVAGCAYGLPAAPEEKELPIIGGEPDSGDPSVVAVYGVRPGSPGGLLCTGSVVAPTVVLTAAHCVAASETGLGVRFSVLTGANLSRGDGEQLAVREVHANPRWSPHNLEAGHDQGVVILSQPTRLRPLSLNRHPLANSTLGQLARIVGYGLADSSTQTGDGIKRQVLTRLQSMSTALIGVGTRRRGTCNGDSGGPAFMEMGGTETIVGTTSFGNSDCTDGGYDARVDTDLAFLDPYLASSCTPTCEQRWCGSDGCGGSCGTCSAGSSCSQAGQCAPSSSGCAAGGREQEPNDSALEANRLCAGGTIQGTLSSVDDQDWFTFSVPAGSTYDVTLTGGPAGAWLRVYKSSSTGRLSFIGDGPEVSRHTDTGGTYQARVLGGDGSGPAYRLAVSGAQ